MILRRTLPALAALALLSACAGTPGASSAPIAGAGQMIRTDGTRWVRADGAPVVLRGANLGNWLVNEFWMMGQGVGGIDDQCRLEGLLDRRFGRAERARLMDLFRDNWMTEADWDRLAEFGVNLVRLPFLHTVVEDEDHPGRLRPDAWRYLDQALERARRRGIYVVLDLHGAAGSQGLEHHSGCAGRNLYWSTPAYRERTAWLWREIAARYRDRPEVAGYSLLNEPWGTDPDTMAREIAVLYRAVRAVDPHHVAILPGHAKNGIDAYGDPRAQGMRNVAFEMHPYPGFFGWGRPGLDVHRGWLQCTAPDGGTCAWQRKLAALDTAFFVGEIQPWAGQGLEQGGQVARASFDRYAQLGWAAAAWSYKVVTNEGGHGDGTWGMVTNAAGARVPKIDFRSASLAEIEGFFRGFGSLRYDSHPRLLHWMTSAQAPRPFAPGGDGGPQPTTTNNDKETKE
ncbi:glycoside hydrolase family 5 protein [uncultured Massilia sp.]|uniref:glycoside hydrolase family 5 protein n=1 Tax=uncultured Massilia sp. TaxID=169973 RepID=UPI0025FB72FD|nr:cellulase family glycosylhydrolase [uncultured Massilia sp.]